ncbi:MAG: FKBP-type peptidyl-prolyl cis-trans isomerase FkpA [Cocleimonas sp.]|jgi:FKBP-type peptidyl-prolyl cis-trans isomerase FkpA
MIIKNILTLTASVSLSFLLLGCGGNANSDAKSVEVAVPKATGTSFQKIDTKVGDGAVAESGQTISVHYTGWLYDAEASDKRGEKFDSSLDRGQPFEFPLGGGRVIKGWDSGFTGMKVGGKRTLIIPAEMGYGSRGAGRSIPPNATLLFDVELLGIK